MKYLLLEYAETPLFLNELPKVKYCYDDNLNISLKTNKPAISSIDCSMDTQTSTKLLDEVTEGDKSNLHLATETFTKTNNESPDTDENFFLNLGTQTKTFVNEEHPDTDADVYSIRDSLITMTTTRLEVEGSDKD